MASPATVEAYPGSILTQAQNEVNIPLTNPNIQGYAIRLSSQCNFHSAVVALMIENRFNRTPMCR